MDVPVYPLYRPSKLGRNSDRGALAARVVRSSWLLLMIAATAVPAGCASRGAPPPRFPGAVRPPVASPAGAASVVDTAVHLEGTPYRNGGTDTSGFDCSGFVQYVFARHGVTVPRNVREQFQAGLAVPRSALVAGDLVFFSTTGRGATHVGIVVDGNDGTFVHAPSERGAVRVERLAADYWSRRYVGARRILF